MYAFLHPAFALTRDYSRSNYTERQTDRQTVIKLVFYAQSTGAVISGRDRQTETERQRQKERGGGGRGGGRSAE